MAQRRAAAGEIPDLLAENAHLMQDIRSEFSEVHLLSELAARVNSIHQATTLQQAALVHEGLLQQQKQQLMLFGGVSPSQPGLATLHARNAATQARNSMQQQLYAEEPAEMHFSRTVQLPAKSPSGDHSSARKLLRSPPKPPTSQHQTEDAEAIKSPFYKRAASNTFASSPRAEAGPAEAAGSSGFPPASNSLAAAATLGAFASMGGDLSLGARAAFSLRKDGRALPRSPSARPAEDFALTAGRGGGGVAGGARGGESQDFFSPVTHQLSHAARSVMVQHGSAPWNWGATSSLSSFLSGEAAEGVGAAHAAGLDATAAALQASTASSRLLKALSHVRRTAAERGFSPAAAAHQYYQQQINPSPHHHHHHHYHSEEDQQDLLDALHQQDAAENSRCPVCLRHGAPLAMPAMTPYDEGEPAEGSAVGLAEAEEGAGSAPQTPGSFTAGSASMAAAGRVARAGFAGETNGSSAARGQAGAPAAAAGGSSRPAAAAAAAAGSQGPNQGSISARASFSAGGVASSNSQSAGNAAAPASSGHAAGNSQASASTAATAQSLASTATAALAARPGPHTTGSRSAGTVRAGAASSNGTDDGRSPSGSALSSPSGPPPFVRDPNEEPVLSAEHIFFHPEDWRQKKQEEEEAEAAELAAAEEAAGGGVSESKEGDGGAEDGLSSSTSPSSPARGPVASRRTSTVRFMGAIPPTFGPPSSSAQAGGSSSGSAPDSAFDRRISGTSDSKAGSAGSSPAGGAGAQAAAGGPVSKGMFQKLGRMARSLSIFSSPGGQGSKNRPSTAGSVTAAGGSALSDTQKASLWFAASNGDAKAVAALQSAGEALPVGVNPLTPAQLAAALAGEERGAPEQAAAAAAATAAPAAPAHTLQAAAAGLGESSSSIASAASVPGDAGGSGGNSVAGSSVGAGPFGPANPFLYSTTPLGSTGSSSSSLFVHDVELRGPLDREDVVLKGPLIKCGRANKYWRSRYMVLRHDSLDYYMDKASYEQELLSAGAVSNVRSSIALNDGAHVLIGAGKVKGVPTRYPFRLATGASEHRLLYLFAAATEDILLSWIGALAALTDTNLEEVLANAEAQGVQLTGTGTSNLALQQQQQQQQQLLLQQQMMMMQQMQQPGMLLGGQGAGATAGAGVGGPAAAGQQMQVHLPG